MGTLAALTRLSPFGPIFGKELRTTARRKRTYWLRFAYLGVLFLVLLLAYTSTAYRSSGYVSVAERAQQEAELGYTFFAAISMFSVISLAVISPVLTATAVSAERQHRTLHVLLMTPITSWQIIAGKLFSRMLAALTLIGLSLPVLAVVRLLGGVEVQTMLGVLGVCVATSLAAAAIGLFYSTFMRRAFAVILIAYVTMGFLYGFVPFITMLTLFAGGRARPPVGFFQFIAAINPFFQVGSMVFPGGPLRGFSPWPCIAIHLSLTLMLVFWSGAVLRRLARKEGESAATATESAAEPPPLDVDLVPSSEGDAAAAAPDSDAAPTVAGGRHVYDNPVLWREIRQPLMKKRWQARFGALACLGLLLVTYVCMAATGGAAYRPLADPEAQIGYAVVFCGLLSLLVCVLSATTIAGEKESDTWTLLLVTPTTGRAVVAGKLLGILRRLMWPSILVAGHFLLFTICGVIPVSALLLVLWVLFTFNSVWIATGLYFSLRVQKVTFAVILNLLTPIAVYVLVLVLLAILGNIIDANGPHGIYELALIYNPYPYLASGIDGLAARRYYSYGGGGRDALHHFWAPMFGERLTAGEFFAVVLVVGAAYLLISGLIIGHTIYHFDRIVGRARQREPIPRLTSWRPAHVGGV
jgi:ABC-type transport system involved in multi-copper enzyme maturation permease subunit